MNEELQESSSSDDESTDYSDWTAEAGVSLEPPKRTAHKQRKKPHDKKQRGKTSSDNEDQKELKDDDDDDEEEDIKENDTTEVWTTPRLQRKVYIFFFFLFYSGSYVSYIIKKSYILGQFIVPVYKGRVVGKAVIIVEDLVCWVYLIP